MILGLGSWKNLTSKLLSWGFGEITDSSQNDAIYANGFPANLQNSDGSERHRLRSSLRLKSGTLIQIMNYQFTQWFSRICVALIFHDVINHCRHLPKTFPINHGKAKSDHNIKKAHQYESIQNFPGTTTVSVSWKDYEKKKFLCPPWFH
ncbi:hypothetical protein G9A89_014754 [Geosiphon pyriformis]|nr:hypothetical protein G9A89_014754 [Geosiphon pyriformis]